MTVKTDKKINDFIIFVIENYKVKKELTVKEIFDIFNEYKVFNYLTDEYDILHTQGKDYLMNDIDIYLENRGYKVKRKNI